MSLKFWRTRNKWEQQMEKEFRFHLDTRIADFLAEGLTRSEAEALARREFGSPDLAKEECREQLTLEWFYDLLRDTRYACRSLGRSPAFVATAVLTLALGIGANTAIFSLIRAVLLRPLPYPNANRLVRIGEGDSQADVNIPEYLFWKDQATSFSSMAGYHGGENQSVVSGAKQEWVPSLFITTNFFRTLGVTPQSGREFIPDETAPQGTRAAILSYKLWRQLGADPNLLGRSVNVGGNGYQVIGILPESFWFPQAAGIFLPLQPTGSVEDNGTNTDLIARLKPAVNWRQAVAETALLRENFRRSHPDLPKDWRGVTITAFQNWLVGDIRPKLILLFGAAALLLSIATLNIASLILSRLASRQKEIAIRRALGSSSQRLLWQFALENLLISLTGGIAGVACARVFLQFLVRQIPFTLPIDAGVDAGVQLDLPVLAFTFLVAFFAGMVFTAAPLFASIRSDIFIALRAAGQVAGSGGVRRHTRSVLITSQVALSATLLVGAVLLIQSLYHLNRESLGFSPQGVLTFVTPRKPERKQNPAELLRFDDQLLHKLTAMPGVQSAAIANVLPLTSQNNFPAERAGHPDQSIGGMEIRLITPEYFSALGIPLLRGRAFTGTDTNASSQVIIVNQTLAHQWWGQSNPLGDQVVIGRFHGKDLAPDYAREVVGVTADTKSVYLKSLPRPTVYVPVDQARWATWGMSWVVRAANLNQVAQNLRQTVAQIDPHQPVTDIRTMEEIVSSTKAEPRFDAWLFGAFAALALLLTAVGLYGLLSFSVARRTSEIGTRLALGASPAQVSKLVLREGVQLVAIGLVIGLTGAVALARGLSSLLFGVQAADPTSYAAVAMVLMIVGCLAGYLPARRAAGVDPMTALRSE